MYKLTSKLFDKIKHLWFMRKQPNPTVADTRAFYIVGQASIIKRLQSITNNADIKQYIAFLNKRVKDYVKYYINDKGHIDDENYNIMMTTKYIEMYYIKKYYEVFGYIDEMKKLEKILDHDISGYQFVNNYLLDMDLSKDINTYIDSHPVIVQAKPGLLFKLPVEDAPAPPAPAVVPVPAPAPAVVPVPAVAPAPAPAVAPVPAPVRPMIPLPAIPAAMPVTGSVKISKKEIHDIIANVLNEYGINIANLPELINRCISPKCDDVDICHELNKLNDELSIMFNDIIHEKSERKSAIKKVNKRIAKLSLYVKNLIKPAKTFSTYNTIDYLFDQTKEVIYFTIVQYYIMNNRDYNNNYLQRIIVGGKEELKYESNIATNMKINPDQNKILASLIWMIKYYNEIENTYGKESANATKYGFYIYFDIIKTDPFYHLYNTLKGNNTVSQYDLTVLNTYINNIWINTVGSTNDEKYRNINAKFIESMMKFLTIRRVGTEQKVDTDVLRFNDILPTKSGMGTVEYDYNIKNINDVKLRGFIDDMVNNINVKIFSMNYKNVKDVVDNKLNNLDKIMKRKETSERFGEFLKFINDETDEAIPYSYNQVFIIDLILPVIKILESCNNLLNNNLIFVDNKINVDNIINIIDNNMFTVYNKDNDTVYFTLTNFKDMVINLIDSLKYIMNSYRSLFDESSYKSLLSYVKSYMDNKNKYVELPNEVLVDKIHTSILLNTLDAYKIDVKRDIVTIDQPIFNIVKIEEGSKINEVIHMARSMYTTDDWDRITNNTLHKATIINSRGVYDLCYMFNIKLSQFIYSNLHIMDNKYKGYGPLFNDIYNIPEMKYIFNRSTYNNDDLFNKINPRGGPALAMNTNDLIFQDSLEYSKSIFGFNNIAAIYNIANYDRFKYEYQSLAPNDQLNLLNNIGKFYQDIKIYVAHLKFSHHDYKREINILENMLMVIEKHYNLIDANIAKTVNFENKISQFESYKIGNQIYDFSKIIMPVSYIYDSFDITYDYNYGSNIKQVYNNMFRWAIKNNVGHQSNYSVADIKDFPWHEYILTRINTNLLDDLKIADNVFTSIITSMGKLFMYNKIIGTNEYRDIQVTTNLFGGNDSPISEYFDNIKMSNDAINDKINTVKEKFIELNNIVGELETMHSVDQNIITEIQNRYTELSQEKEKLEDEKIFMESKYALCKNVVDLYKLYNNNVSTSREKHQVFTYLPFLMIVIKTMRPVVDACKMNIDNIPASFDYISNEIYPSIRNAFMNNLINICNQSPDIKNKITEYYINIIANSKDDMKIMGGVQIKQDDITYKILPSMSDWNNNFARVKYIVDRLLVKYDKTNFTEKSIDARGNNISTIKMEKMGQYMFAYNQISPINIMIMMRNIAFGYLYIFGDNANQIINKSPNYSKLNTNIFNNIITLNKKFDRNNMIISFKRTDLPNYIQDGNDLYIKFLSVVKTYIGQEKINMISDNISNTENVIDYII